MDLENTPDTLPKSKTRMCMHACVNGPCRPRVPPRPSPSPPTSDPPRRSPGPVCFGLVWCVVGWVHMCVRVCLCDRERGERRGVKSNARCPPYIFTCLYSTPYCSSLLRLRCFPFSVQLVPRGDSSVRCVGGCDCVCVWYALPSQFTFVRSQQRAQPWTHGFKLPIYPSCTRIQTPPTHPSTHPRTYPSSPTHVGHPRHSPPQTS